jgi:uncharacterized membrane protein YdjX (TVP38/TMEM64 family)
MADALGWLLSFLQSLDEWRLVAWLVFIAVHVAFAVAFLPCSGLTALAGFAFGGWAGLGVSTAAAILSSVATFLIARHMLVGRVRRAVLARRDRLPLADAAIRLADAADWKGVLLLQLNPAVPASSSGYLFGLSRIGVGEYMLATLLAIAPMQVLLVAAGAVSRHTLHGLAADALPLIAIAVLAGIVALLIAIRIVYIQIGRKRE